MNGYNVGKLSKLAGVSIRTLHHYDQIGLLKPSHRSEKGYRLYLKQDLLRLQQILFFRELDFSLKDIQDVLENPDYDQLTALISHREILQARAARLSQLVATIDSTINYLKGETMTLTDQDLYAGFSDEQIAAYKQEIKEKYNPDLVRESEQRISKMSKQEWQQNQEQHDSVCRQLAAIMDHEPPESEAVQQLVAQHHAYIETFYHADATTYRGLAEMYACDDRFQAFYEKYRTGLTDFLKAAMLIFAENRLA